MVPYGNIFFISESLYTIAALFLMKACEFFIIRLCTITKFTLKICDLNCLTPLLLIFLTMRVYVAAYAVYW